MSRKRQNLQSVVAAENTGKAKAEPQEQAATSGEGQTYVAPSRRGRKALTVYLDPDAVKQLKHIAADEDTSTQALVSEALNELFRSRGKGRIA